MAGEAEPKIIRVLDDRFDLEQFFAGDVRDRPESGLFFGARGRKT